MPKADTMDHSNFLVLGRMVEQIGFHAVRLLDSVLSVCDGSVQWLSSVIARRNKLTIYLSNYQYVKI